MRRRDEYPKKHGGVRRDWETIKTLLPYLWPDNQRELRFRVVLALLFLGAAKGANIIVPLFYKEAVDLLSEPGALLAVPIALLLGYGLARVGAQAFGEIRDAVFAKVAHRAIRAVAMKTFKHLHALSLRFHLDRQTGGLSRVVERGTRAIEFLLNFMLFNILPTLLEITLVCLILWKLYGVSYALITFVTIGGYIAWTLAVTEWRMKYRREMNESDNKANTKAVDSLLNYETVKYFSNEEHEARRYDEALQKYETAAVKSKVSLAFLNIGQGAIIAVGLVLVMLMAGNGVIAGSMTVGDFVLVNTYLIQLYLPLNFLGFVYREMKHSLTDMDHMFTLLAENTEVEDNPDARDLVVTKGEVVFDHVSFGYDERRPILKDVSFTVPAGQRFAIVGPTGAGKSTISRLLFRFYDIDDGRITIDGQDLRAVTQKSLRSLIGIVPQDTVLFNDTIRYNIAYGSPGSSNEAVENAAQLAKIHDFAAKMPDGYATMVGERGLKLSGGEKQRVAIARTILKNPALLVFDEATSALDTHTEKEIQASLNEVSAERTTLVIAHRLSTVVDADQIIVLADGRIAERGTHEELLRIDGQYAGLWRRQQEANQAREVLEHTNGVTAPSVAAQ